MQPDTEARQEELRRAAAMDRDDLAEDNEDTNQEHENIVQEHDDTAQEHEDMDSDPEDTLREPEDIAPEAARDSDEAEFEDALDEPVVAHGSASPAVTAQPPTGLWPEGAADDLRQRWNAIQLRFVDDPPAVANDLHALIGEAMESLQESLTQRRQEVDSWTSSTTDTEELRQLVSRYRSLFESLID